MKIFQGQDQDFYSRPRPRK